MRSDEDILAGVLTVSLGRVEKALPELKIKALREWKGKLGAELTAIGQLDLASTASLGQLVNVASDKILEAVLAYDTSGALGGREWLEDNATEAEVYRVFREMIDAAFPFVRDIQAAMAQLTTMNLATSSPPPSFTNGALPTGASTPTPSKRG